MTIRTVLVGTDGSSIAAAAVSYAVELTRVTGARLVVATAVGLLDSERDPDRRDSLSADLQGTWTAPARADVPMETVQRDGHPVQVMLDDAEEANADVIVVAAAGSGGSRGCSSPARAPRWRSTHDVRS